MAKSKLPRSGPARVRRPRPAPVAALPLHYVETSALLAAVLEGDGAARRTLERDEPLLTSALTFAEAFRAIVRAQSSGRLSESDARLAIGTLQALEERFDVIHVTEAMLARAGRPFPHEPIRTLDAIHLATAEAIDEPPQLVTIVTRDDRVRDNAKALGYPVE